MYSRVLIRWNPRPNDKGELTGIAELHSGMNAAFLDESAVLVKGKFDVAVALRSGSMSLRGIDGGTLPPMSVNLLPTTVHIYFGSVVGALPSGRKNALPLSDGISPSQGADVHGPTAVLKSAARIDHAHTGGTLLNMKFNPQVLAGEGGVENLAHLIRAYFKLDGHHIQFNVIDAETLRQAQEKPEENRNLIVRVAGYSDYFVDLGPDLQNEIIARTEQQSF